MTRTGTRPIPGAVWTPCVRSLTWAEKQINLFSTEEAFFKERLTRDWSGPKPN